MVIFRSGNLLDSEMQTLVNTVNCVGVMGKGIALDFKNRYPAMFRDYELRCRRGEVKPGIPYRFPEMTSFPQLALDLVDQSSDQQHRPVIVNFPTKDHWKGKSTRDFVVGGLEQLRANLHRWGIQSIALPALGCANGGLDWSEIGPFMHDFLSDLEIPVEIYVPPGIDPEAPFAEHAELAVARS